MLAIISLVLNCQHGNFKSSQLGASCPYATVYCYLELKLCYLKNLNLFLTRVKKQIFEDILLRLLMINQSVSNAR